MEATDLKKLESELGEFTGTVEVVFCDREGDALAREIEALLRTLEEMSKGAVTYRKADADSHLPEGPAFTLTSAGRGRIHYLTLPEKNEIAPFVRALEYAASGAAPIDPDAEADLARISEPADIRVFVSPFCPNCPRVVQTLAAFASRSPLLSVFIFDVERHHELAAAFGIKAVPAIVIDQELVRTGQITPCDLAKLLADRGTESYDRELLRSLMEHSRPSDAAALLCEGRGRKAILELFQEPELSTRMGVLVVLEQTLDRDPTVLTDMVPSLIELLSHDDPRIRGDIADFLGTVGDPRAVPHLEKLTDDPDPDVVEAARDALEAFGG